MEELSRRFAADPASQARVNAPEYVVPTTDEEQYQRRFWRERIDWELEHWAWEVADRLKLSLRMGLTYEGTYGQRKHAVTFTFNRDPQHHFNVLFWVPWDGPSYLEVQYNGVNRRLTRVEYNNKGLVANLLWQAYQNPIVVT